MKFILINNKKKIRKTNKVQILIVDVQHINARTDFPQIIIEKATTKLSNVSPFQ